jgi:hypothetical protein
MLSGKIAHKIAQELPGVSEKDHFGGNGFYVNKRIFATLWPDKNEVNARLNPDQQKAFVAKKPKAFAAVPNAFGQQGWTTITLAAVDKKLFTQALQAAWENGALKSPRASPPRKNKAKSAPRKRPA